MQLSDVLSKQPKAQYMQVDGFLQNKKGNVGQQVSISVGKVALNYFCNRCEDLRTFYSQGNITCIFVNKRMISIDCVLSCGCGASVQAWFLVECDNDITSQAPNVRIIKRSEKLSDDVKINSSYYGDFSVLLDKAECAYREGLGAGAVIYLRKIFEKITIQAAESIGMEYEKHETGNPKNFRSLLENVDKECEIIPREFSKDGYRLFRELSGVIHGNYDENLGLQKFEPLHRLVIGILENVRNSRDFADARAALGWQEGGK